MVSKYSAALLFVLLSGLLVFATAGDGAPPLRPEEYRALREEARERERRIIYNSDGGIRRFWPDGERILESRYDGLEDTHVDAVFQSITTGTFGRSLAYTEVAEPYPLAAGLPEVAKGFSPLQFVVDFARRNDIEVFASMRMNDTHDAAWDPEDLSRFKKDNPDYLLGERGHGPPHGRWSSVNFAYSDVRDLAFRSAEELLRNYDLDGIELDFFRHPVFFLHMPGHAVGRRQLDAMTGLIRRIRRMSEEVGRESGRPILLAVRVPDSLEYCRAIGLDLETWLSEGLIDIMTVSGYFRLNPWSYSAELGRKHGVKVYAGLSETRVGGGHHAHAGRASDESYRARAMSAWASGMDGIYTFNLFHPRRPVFSQMGEPRAMEGLDKVYYLSVRGGRRGAGNPFPIGDYINIPTVNPDKPLELQAGKTEYFEMVVGHVADKSPEPEAAPGKILKLLLFGIEGADEIEVRLNGNLLEDVLIEEKDSGAAWFAFRAGNALREGLNKIEVTAEPGATKKPHLLDVLLEVAYSTSWADRAEDMRLSTKYDLFDGCRKLDFRLWRHWRSPRSNSEKRFITDSIENFGAEDVPEGMYRFFAAPGQEQIGLRTGTMRWSAGQSWKVRFSVKMASMPRAESGGHVFGFAVFNGRERPMVYFGREKVALREKGWTWREKDIPGRLLGGEEDLRVLEVVYSDADRRLTVFHDGEQIARFDDVNWREDDDDPYFRFLVNPGGIADEADFDWYVGEIAVDFFSRSALLRRGDNFIGLR